VIKDSSNYHSSILFYISFEIIDLRIGQRCWKERSQSPAKGLFGLGQKLREKYHLTTENTEKTQLFEFRSATYEVKEAAVAGVEVEAFADVFDAVAEPLPEPLWILHHQVMVKET